MLVLDFRMYSQIFERTIFFQLFGPGFSLEKVLATIVKVKPHTVALGSHHYVQLAESEILKQVKHKLETCYFI